MSEDYEKLLDRALEVVPKLTLERGRLQVPEPELVTMGNCTVLRNFRSIASSLDREPEHLMKYLLRELGVAGSAKGAQAIFQSRFARPVIDERIKRYIDEFVLCRECAKPDTKLLKRGRVYMLKCGACGALASVRSV